MSATVACLLFAAFMVTFANDQTPMGGYAAYLAAFIIAMEWDYARLNRR